MRLETERLVMAPVTENDLPAMRALQADPTVAVTLSPDGRSLTPDDARATIDRAVGYWREFGVGPWSLRLKDGEGTWIGYAGLRRRHWPELDPEPVERWELMYGLRSPWWGGGITAEAARAALTDARDRCGIRTIHAMTLWTNRGSRRVMEKLGFSGRMPIMHLGLPSVLMRLDL